MDTETIGIMVTLFGLNYGALWALYRRLDSLRTPLSIICREHAKNHGGQELKL